MIKSVLITSILLSSHAGAMSLKDKTCLYNSVYYEANTEGVAGKRAVADVILNRSKQQNKSICKVVNQKNQFSFVGKKKMKPLDSSYLQDVLSTHKQLDESYNHFYHKSIKPSWRKSCSRKKVIGSHIFCVIREKQ